jgi:RNA polymerase sigma-70 factor (ECF subfamily)
MTTTPVSLLERLRRPNEQAAWERFAKLYTPLLCHWAHRLEVRGAEVDDLVQEVFIVLVKKLPEFRYDPNKSFRAWLWTVLTNKLHDRQRRQGVPNATAFGGKALDPIGPDTAGAIDEAEYRRYLMRRALELMESEFQPATWKAFWECVVNERPAADVAAELHLTENAVYLAKGRVARRLREELSGLLD